MNALIKIALIYLFIPFGSNAQDKLEYFEFFECNFYRSEFTDTAYSENGITWITFYSDSTKSFKSTVSQLKYKNGNLSCYLRTGSHSNKAQYLKEVCWSESGKLESFNFKDDGKLLYIRMNNNLICAKNFNTTKYEDQMFCWNSNGEKIAEYIQKSDSLITEYFYSDNSLKEKIYGKKIAGSTYLNGKYEFYHPNGNLFIQGQYEYSDQIREKTKSNSSEHYKSGTWKYFNTAGKLILTEEYKAGKLLTREKSKHYKAFISKESYLDYEMLVAFEANPGRPVP